MTAPRATALALLLCGACAGALGRGAGSQHLVLVRDSPPVIGDADAVRLALHNRGQRTLRLPRPSAPYLLVHAQDDLGRLIPCASPPGLPERIELVELGPDERLPFQVDFTRRCELGARRQQFVGEVRYSVPPGVRDAPGGGDSWIGITAPARIQIAPAVDGPAAGSG